MPESTNTSNTAGSTVSIPKHIQEHYKVLDLPPDKVHSAADIGTAYSNCMDNVPNTHPVKASQDARKRELLAARDACNLFAEQKKNREIGGAEKKAHDSNAAATPNIATAEGEKYQASKEYWSDNKPMTAQLQHSGAQLLVRALYTLVCMALNKLLSGTFIEDKLNDYNMGLPVGWCPISLPPEFKPKDSSEEDQKFDTTPVVPTTEEVVDGFNNAYGKNAAKVVTAPDGTRRVELSDEAKKMMVREQKVTPEQYAEFERYVADYNAARAGLFGGEDGVSISKNADNTMKLAFKNPHAVTDFEDFLRRDLADKLTATPKPPPSPAAR